MNVTTETEEGDMLLPVRLLGGETVVCGLEVTERGMWCRVGDVSFDVGIDLTGNAAAAMFGTETEGQITMEPLAGIAGDPETVAAAAPGELRA